MTREAKLFFGTLVAWAIVFLLGLKLLEWLF